MLAEQPVSGDRGPVAATVTGAWLVSRRRRMDQGEAEWLTRLGEFVASRGYELDGQLSAVSWLAVWCGMARSTGFEKVKVAMELRRRPWLTAALQAGSVSYSAIRAICRIDIADQTLDEQLLQLAVAGTIDDLNRAVRHWLALADQDRPPPPDRIGYHSSHGFHGTGRIVIEAPNDMIDELDAVVAAFTPKPSTDPTDLIPWWRRRLDGLLDAGRTALAHAKDGHAMGADLYTVHVIADLDRLHGRPGLATLTDGTPIDDATLDRIRCDCAIVTHLTRNGTEPVNLGRKTREWSTAQRRAIQVRDHYRCVIPGCVSTHVDIHHLQAWEHDGPTNINNGACLCRRHHTAVHQGRITVTGDANHTLTFHRPDGTTIATHTATNPNRLFT